MKKNLVFLLLAIAVLVAILFVQKQKGVQDAKAMFALDSTQRSSVQTIKVVKANDSATLHLMGNEWVIASDSFPADTAKVNKLLGTIYKLEDKEIVSKNPAMAKEFGLDSTEAKQVVLKDAAGKELVKVEIGKTAGTDYSSTYWRWVGKDDVYRTAGNFGYDVNTSQDEWKQKKLFDIKKDDIKSIQVAWEDTSGQKNEYTVESASEGKWKMLSPRQGDAKADAAKELAERFGDISIDSFIDTSDTNISQANLDAPKMIIQIKMKEGQFYKLEAGASFNGYTYVNHPKKNLIVKVSDWRLDIFHKKADDLYEAPKVDSSKLDSTDAATDSSLIKN